MIPHDADDDDFGFDIFPLSSYKTRRDSQLNNLLHDDKISKIDISFAPSQQTSIFPAGPDTMPEDTALSPPPKSRM
jgi:hypothetical protein